MSTFYTPLFNRIVDSSIWAEPDHVCKVFITLLSIQDKDHVVRLSAYQIAHRARKTEQEVLDALQILSAPDKRRLEDQPEDGRRIKKVEDGWFIINGEKYQNEMQKLNRAAYQAGWQARHRRDGKPAIKRGRPLPNETANERALKEGDTATVRRIEDQHAARCDAKQRELDAKKRSQPKRSGMLDKLLADPDKTIESLDDDKDDFA